jgi:hypothetical protein
VEKAKPFERQDESLNAWKLQQKGNQPLAQRQHLLASVFYIAANTIADNAMPASAEGQNIAK